MDDMKHLGRILEKISTQRQIVTLLAVGIFVVIAGCTTASVTPPAGQTVSPSTTLTKVSVALDWFPWSGQAGLWVAKEKGYFAQEGLDVQLNVPADPSLVLQTVGSGKDDFGMSYLPDVILAREQDVPVVSVMALAQHPLYSIIALKESNIDEPKDLVGKKLGHSGIAFNNAIMATVLKSQGESLEDVETVNLGFDIAPALIGKQVDAILGYWTYESIVATNQGYPVNVLHVEQFGVPDYYELVLITNEEKIAKNLDVVGHFVRAIKRGYEDAMADPQGAVQLMKQVNPEMDLNIDSKGVDLLAPLWKADNGVAGWQEESTWTAFVKWAKDAGFLSKDIGVTKAFDNSFIANAGK